MLTNDQILSIITDDKKFLKTILLPDDYVTSTIKHIPRNSFTALRLLYSSPSDISKASEITMFGGVPRYWHHEQRSRFWHSFLKLYTNDLRRRMDLLTYHDHMRVSKQNSLTIKPSSKKRIYSMKMKHSTLEKLVKSEKKKEKGYSLPVFRVKSKRGIKRRNSTGSINTFRPFKVLTFDYLKSLRNDQFVINGVSSLSRSPKSPYNKLKKNGQVSSDVKVDNKNKVTTENNPKILNLCEMNRNYSSLTLLEPIAEKLELNTNLHDTVLTRIGGDAQVKNESKLIQQKIKSHISGFPNKYQKRSANGDMKILLSNDALILQKISLVHKPPSSAFNEIENIDTRIEDRWRESFAILVETNNIDVPLMIKCYKRRAVTKSKPSENKTLAYKPFLIIPLDSKSIINFYSSLDKTISVQTNKIVRIDTQKIHPVEFLRIYVIRFKLIETSFQWLMLLGRYFKKWKIPKQYLIKVPELNKSFSTSINFQLQKQLTAIEASENNVVKIATTRKSIFVFPDPFIRYLLILLLNKTRDHDSGKDIRILESLLKSNKIMGCDLKMYDRIEWYQKGYMTLFQQSFLLSQTHCFEFRSIKNYPFSCEIPEEEMEEPSSVEGFLLKCDFKDNPNNSNPKKITVKPCYFSTYEHLLFYVSSHKSSPLFPKDFQIEEMSSIERTGTNPYQFKELPDIIQENPYELSSDDRIRWLMKDFSSAEFEEHDSFAFKSYNRRVLQILKSEGIIDLTLIQEVRKQYSWEHVVNPETLGKLLNVHCTFWGKFIRLYDFRKSVIIIETKHGSRIILMAQTPKIATLWVKSLQKMVTYWKHRKNIDLENACWIRKQNMKKLKLSELEEANIGDSTPKWILDKGKANDLTFNINGISLLRPIIFKGTLFQKKRKHSSFHKYYAILIPGFLMLYSCTQDSFSKGNNILCEYTLYRAITIDNCYLYSGRAASSSSLVNAQNIFNILEPGNHAIPKAYEDNLTTTEEDISRCFTLYFSKKPKHDRILSYISKAWKADLSSGELSDNRQFNNPLQPYCDNMVFMTKSRQHRDAWLHFLYQELERLNNAS